MTSRPWKTQCEQRGVRLPAFTRRLALKFTHNKLVWRNYRACPAAAITPGLSTANLASGGETWNVVQLQSRANSTDTPSRLIPNSSSSFSLLSIPLFGWQPVCLLPCLHLQWRPPNPRHPKRSSSPWKLPVGTAKEWDCKCKFGEANKMFSVVVLGFGALDRRCRGSKVEKNSFFSQLSSGFETDENDPTVWVHGARVCADTCWGDFSQTTTVLKMLCGCSATGVWKKWLLDSKGKREKNIKKKKKNLLMRSSTFKGMWPYLKRQRKKLTKRCIWGDIILEKNKEIRYAMSEEFKANFAMKMAK